MMIVKVVMWPGGDASKERILSVATFTCVHADPATGERSYEARILKDAEFIHGGSLTDPNFVRSPGISNLWRIRRVGGHVPGRRGTWDLIGAFLAGVLGDRIKGYTISQGVEDAPRR